MSGYKFIGLFLFLSSNAMACAGGNDSDIFFAIALVIALVTTYLLTRIKKVKSLSISKKAIISLIIFIVLVPSVFIVMALTLPEKIFSKDDGMVADCIDEY